ncbi:nucleotide-diphospho-sugar transferase [Dyadobacter sp. CY356]|uniref:nucleotide-diphospho-sugar transferase n=1 Tax=Dyadobacter sp. CY356 TaxID=2906442 RepID=UPI001F3A2795|nr:nucleotide-diphospho-sugar transferase [Dyadobacter sp. CY356]MCF0058308.1 nucleotide-diphospho-sugar transferase [Dyadobacter sp. CY356]
MYQIKSPVLLLVFNRPDTTQLVFEQIRKGKPDKLYIAADGARDNKDGEKELCQQTRELLNIDWDCEVKTLFRENNLGCKLAVSGGIKWFFENEEEGIVLEDDCLPNEDFFRFCDSLLEKYRFDTRIMHIGGTNLLSKKFGTDTYYFSKFTNVWGWASWRRVWVNYDENLDKLDEFIKLDLLKYVYQKDTVRKYLTNAFIQTRNNYINTWDYQYAFLNFWNNGLSVCPNYNMITNIGFNERGTHTNEVDHKLANLPLESFDEITHPKFFVPIIDADYSIFEMEEINLAMRVRKKLKRVVAKFL